MLGLPEGITACLFDLDGVLTDTASVHTIAWAEIFDTYLRDRAGRTGDSFVAFDPEADYQRYVDARPRPDGVRTFLASRGIQLPEGNPDDPPGTETVYGLGNRKDQIFTHALNSHGIQVFGGAKRYLEAVTRAGMLVAVVSGSAHAAEVLQRSGLQHFVQVRVDGITLKEQRLAGKPSPDSFRYAAQGLGVHPSNAAVFEDAVTGVRAGRAGGFGLIVGVDDGAHADALRVNGADIVVGKLSELLDLNDTQTGPVVHHVRLWWR
ncbi:MAG: beta-phosphoglucomutase family hydrolase [Actinomycetota bacterium]